jgi:hypothetical protein
LRYLSYNDEAVVKECKELIRSRSSMLASREKFMVGANIKDPKVLLECEQKMPKPLMECNKSLLAILNSPHTPSFTAGVPEVELRFWH